MQHVRDDSVEQLERIEAQLNAEAKEDEAARSHYGSEWPMQVLFDCRRVAASTLSTLD